MKRHLPWRVGLWHFLKKALLTCRGLDRVSFAKACGWRFPRQLTTSAAGSALAFLVACNVFLFGGFCPPEVLAMHSNIKVTDEAAEVKMKASRIRGIVRLLQISAAALLLPAVLTM